jgi:hypothetical protein
MREGVPSTGYERSHRPVISLLLVNDDSLDSDLFSPVHADIPRLIKDYSMPTASMTA